jgi:hypothetical protein
LLIGQKILSLTYSSNGGGLEGKSQPYYTTNWRIVPLICLSIEVSEGTSCKREDMEVPTLIRFTVVEKRVGRN